MFRNWYRFIYVLPNIDKEIIKLITNFYLMGNNKSFIINNTYIFFRRRFNLTRELILFQIGAIYIFMQFKVFFIVIKFGVSFHFCDCIS